MDLIYQVLGWPLGWIMWLCYNITHSYGISLLIFTLLIRGALFPLSLKQQKSTVKMQLIRPQMEEIQAKYKTNKEKLNEEMMKLYQKEGYNPMSGCLPLLIQMPILFGLIDVIYRPLTHILRISSELIDVGENIVFGQGLVNSLKGLNTAQLHVISGVRNDPSAFAAMGAEAIAKINTFDLSFMFMNLGETPNLSMFGDILNGIWNPVIIIPVLSGLTSLLVSIISIRAMQQPEGAGAAAGASMKGMMLMMPIFSTMIAFSVPAGVGLYWCYSNLASILQTLVLNKYYNPREMAAKAKAEYEERQERERQERIEAKKLAKERGEEMQQKAMSQKEINRRKLAEARRRDAEKYGEQYIEVTDDDLN